MIKSKFHKIMRSKLTLSLFVLVCVCLVFDLAVILFNVIELMLISSNSAKLSSGFVAFNIASIVINVCLIIAIVVLLILKKMEKIK